MGSQLVRGRRRVQRRAPATRTLIAPRSRADVCLELKDHSVSHRSAVEFFSLEKLRDPIPAAARLLSQFENRNRGLLSLMDVQISQIFDGQDLIMRLEAGSNVGAVPLISPTRATPDYGLVVQPRFPWKGIGSMLAQMGWRIAPLP